MRRKSRTRSSSPTATISRMRRHVEAEAAGDRVEQPLDEVALVFQKIELTNTAGKTMATDDWTARA